MLATISGMFIVVGVHPTPNGSYAVNLRTEDAKYVTVFQDARPSASAFSGELTVLSEKDVEVDVKDEDGTTHKEPRKNVVCSISRIDTSVKSLQL